MSNHIKQIEINNFKAIKELKIDNIRPINILVGDNNTGKTTILEAINLFERPFDFANHLRLLSRKYNPNIIKYNLIKEMFNNCDFNNSININIEVNNINNNLTIQGQEQEVVYFEADEDDDFTDEDKATEKIILDYNFNNKSNTYSIDNSKRSSRSLSKEKNANLNMGYVMPIDTYMERSTLKAIDTVIKNGEKQKLINLLKLFDENITDLNYTSDREIYITIKDRSTLSLSSFGDGLKKAIVLISKIIDSKDGILLIDEIETGIHKDILGMIFSEVIKNSKEYNTQIVATTHSRETIEAILENLEDSLQDIALYRLENFRGKLYARRFSGEDAYEVMIQEGGDLR